MCISTPDLARSQNKGPVVSRGPESATATVSTAAIARRWKVTQRTAQRWVQRWGAAVVADEIALAEKLLGDRKTPAAIRMVAAGCLVDRAQQAAVAATTDVAGDPQAAAGDLRSRLDQLEYHGAWADKQLRICQTLNDEAGVLTYSRLYKDLNAAIVTNRLAQFKLGVDVGELLPRTEVVRLFRALFSRLCLGIQRVRDKVCPLLIGLNQEAEVLAVLEPVLIANLIISPVARATNLAAGVGLPAWVIIELRRAFADHIADGDQQLTAAQAVEAECAP
jgi:hypothetical protein